MDIRLLKSASDLHVNRVLNMFLLFFSIFSLAEILATIIQLLVP